MRECLENVRKIAPVIHNITNYVTMNDVANALLACGAKPIMADAVEEAAEITAGCAGLNLNMGTLQAHRIPAMLAAGVQANESEHPVLLDPVGVGASAFRRKTAEELLKNIHFSVIRGNMSEIRAIAQKAVSAAFSGVDVKQQEAVTEEKLDESITFVKNVAKSVGSIIVVTGAVDLVADEGQCYVIRNGRAEMSKVTGTGCQLSGIITAYLAANPKEPLKAAAAAVGMMGLSGEIAWERMQPEDGNMTYRGRIIDALYHMNGEILERGMCYEVR